MVGWPNTPTMTYAKDTAAQTGQAHAGQPFGLGPQAALQVRVEGTGGRPAALWVAGRSGAATRAIIFTAAGFRIGGRAQHRQRAHRGALREQGLDEQRAEPPGQRQVPRKLGARVPGMGRQRHRGRPRLRQPALQLVGEQQVGQLGPAVAPSAGTRARGTGRRSRSGPGGAENCSRHHAGAGHGEHAVQEQAGQRERAEVVRRRTAARSRPRSGRRASSSPRRC